MTVVGTLVVDRPGSPTYRRRSFRVLVDGVARGDLADGGQLRLAVPPGRHRVLLRSGWTGSPALDVETGPGTTHRVRVEPRAHWWRAVLPFRQLQLSQV